MLEEEKITDDELKVCISCRKCLLFISYDRGLSYGVGREP